MSTTESLIASISAALLSSSMLLAFCSIFLAATSGSTLWSTNNFMQMAVLLIYAGLLYLLFTIGKHGASARQTLWKASAVMHVLLIGGWFIALEKLAAVFVAPEFFCALLHGPGLALARKAAFNPGRITVDI